MLAHCNVIFAMYYISSYPIHNSFRARIFVSEQTVFKIVLLFTTAIGELTMLLIGWDVAFCCPMGSIIPCPANS